MIIFLNLTNKDIIYDIYITPKIFNDIFIILS